MVEDCPFDPEEGETVHVVILDRKPSRKELTSLLALRSEADDFAGKGKQAYNLRHDREKTVFSNNLVEKMLGVPGTTRSLTTIQKLLERYG